MRTLATLSVLLLIVIECSPNVRADENQSLDTIRWVLGDWTCTTDKEIASESWNESGEGIFRGRGQIASKSDSQIRSRESLLLVEMSGEVFYIAKVKENESPVSFRLTVSSSSHAVFENMKHDFPKRLEYRLEGNSELKVTVSDGDKRSFVLHFSKLDRRQPNAGNN